MLIPEVSIIIPVYNVEKYLSSCLDSVLGQTMKEIEIIIIDDGSTDNSGKICNTYAKKDERIRVFHQKNMGLSVSRNKGIKNAQGKYVMFVDADDIVDPHYCEIPYKSAIKNEADLVMFEFQLFKDGDKITFNSIIKCEQILSVQKTITAILTKYGCTVWNKLYSLSLFDDVCFPEGKTTEDIGTTYKTVLKANKICTIDSLLYYYRKRKGSITDSPNKQRMKDCLLMYMEQYDNLVDIAEKDSIPYLKASLLNASILYKMRVMPCEIDQYHSLSKRIIKSCYKYKHLLSENRRYYLDLYLNNRLRFHYECIKKGERLLLR